MQRGLRNILQAIPDDRRSTLISHHLYWENVHLETTLLKRSRRKNVPLDAPEGGTMLRTQRGVKVYRRTKETFQGYAETQTYEV